MKKTFLTIVISLFSIPSFACECHGSNQSSGPFGSFAGWQLPNAGCIPTHSLTSNKINKESNDRQDLVEENQVLGSESPASEKLVEPSAKAKEPSARVKEPSAKAKQPSAETST